MNITIRRFNLSKIFIFGFIFFCIPILVFGQNLLNKPESIIFDEQHDRYLVTCNGNGKIVGIDNAGNKDTFKAGFSNLLGSHISENTIYVSSDSGVKGFDLTDTSEVFNVPIPGSGQIDGITTDTSGNLYVIDGTYRRIYKIKLSTQTYNIFANSGLPVYPQDCIFDEENNRLIVVAWAPNAPIQAVNLSDSSVSTIVATTFRNFDGIISDQFGNIYVSSHSTFPYNNGKIYKYDKNFANPPVSISSGHSEPAGLGYNSRDNILAVPNYGSNSIDYIQIIPSSIQQESINIGDRFKLFHNYPNPFNPETNISYQLAQQDKVTITIFNSLGQKVKTLLDENQSQGYYSITWDGKNETGRTMSSGVYFYQLKTNSKIEMKKMIMIK